MKTNIPTNWTFKDANIAETFDSHVREQLPWYDLVTRSVVHIARHYIPPGGLVYDIGCSTGNMHRALGDILVARKARFIGIEESKEMLARYISPGSVDPLMLSGATDYELINANALEVEYKMFDFGICFLTFMFFPVAERIAWLSKVISMLRPGGAFVLVDKLNTPNGYAGTVLRRLSMQWKMDNGADPKDIVAKELSLAGFQRPCNPSLFRDRGQVFFQFGEFIGILFERPH